MHRSALLLALVLSPAVSLAQDHVARELMVRIRPGASGADLRAMERRAGVRIVEESTSTGVLLVELRRGATLSRAFDRLARDASVSDVSLNAIARAASPDDPYYYLQWNLDAVGAYEGDILPDASGVTVAVVDTGVATDAPDLGGVSFTGGYDFVNDDADPNDDNAHGTHIAGVIAQATDNGLGTAGLAVDATLMSIKVLDAGARGTEFDIIEGIASAAADGAEVINLSFEFGAGYEPSRAMEDAIRDALDGGAVIVAAAGNGGTDTVSYPAAFRGVIAVGAASLDAGGEIIRAPYSNYGSDLDVLAPGGNLDVDADGDGIPEGILAETFDPAAPGSYEPYLLEGTSGAAAHVSASAALLLADGSLSGAEIPDVIVETAVDLGSPGYDVETGAGLLDTTPSDLPPPKLVIPNAEVQVARTRDNCTVSATATVVVRDQDGNAIEGALVFGRWGGSVSLTPSPAPTDADGVVTFDSPSLTFEGHGNGNGRGRGRGRGRGKNRPPRCGAQVDRGTLFAFAVGTVVAADGSATHPAGHTPDGWFLAWLLPGRGTQLRGAGLVLPPMGLDYFDARTPGVPLRMDARLLEPFGLVFGNLGDYEGEENDLGPIRGAILNPYSGNLLAVHDLNEAEGLVFAGGGDPDPGDEPPEELDAQWESFGTGVAIFSPRGLARAGGGDPDPGDLPGPLAVVPDALEMLEALDSGELVGPSVPLATDAARLVPLSKYLQ